MGRINKVFSFLLVVILAVSSLMMVESAFAQSIPKPSVPEFSLKYEDHSYDVQPVYSTDPYTGKSTLTQAGYHVQNKSIEVWINNQAFSNYRDTNSNIVMLYYDVQWKGHFMDYWTNSNFETYSSNGLHLVASSSLLADDKLVSPNAPFTIITIGFVGNNGSDSYALKTDDISAGGQIDFQVQAFIGYYTMQESTPDPLFHRTHTIYTFHGESSDWGNTQTLTIPETSSLSTLIVMFAVFLGIIVTLLLLLFRRHRKTISQNKPNV